MTWFFISGLSKHKFLCETRIFKLVSHSIALIWLDKFPILPHDIENFFLQFRNLHTFWSLTFNFVKSITTYIAKIKCWIYPRRPWYRFHYSLRPCSHQKQLSMVTQSQRNMLLLNQHVLTSSIETTNKLNCLKNIFNQLNIPVSSNWFLMVFMIVLFQFILIRY